MAKAALAIFSTLCIVAAMAGSGSCLPGESFTVKGKVYCDPCHLKFETRISENIADAVVKLECRNMTTEKVTYTKETKTGADGTYSMMVEGEHEDEICDVTVEKSPREDCKEAAAGLEKAQVVLSDNVGMHSNVRYANPLFFMKEKVSKDCAKVMKELDFVPLEM
nr:anther-specific protein LAT52-like [Ipomoea batatas]